MIEPKEIEIDGKKFIISKFPAIAGREIMTQYPISEIPKAGEYSHQEELVLKIMCFVGVNISGASHPLMLNSKALVDNHVPSWEVLIRLERAIMEYNCSFFQDGRPSTVLEEFARKLIMSVTKTSMDSSEPSLIVEKPLTTN